MDANISFEKRMLLSSITYVPGENISHTLQRQKLNNNCFMMIQDFKSTVEEPKSHINAMIDPLGSLMPHLFCVLTYSLRIINGDRQQEQQQRQSLKKSEPNFIIKYVTNFMQHILFSLSGRIYINWDIFSGVYGDSQRKNAPTILYTQWAVSRLVVVKLNYQVHLQKKLKKIDVAYQSTWRNNFTEDCS